MEIIHPIFKIPKDPKPKEGLHNINKQPSDLLQRRIPNRLHDSPKFPKCPSHRTTKIENLQ